MKILGIDPGSTITGFGIIEADGSVIRHCENGGIHLKPSESLSNRLATIYREIETLIGVYKPDAVAIESVFVANNVASTMKLGQARGAAIVAAVNAGLPVAEYSPREVKQALTGYGAASKEQIQQMVKMLLKLPDVPFEDAADALAIAICHCQTHRWKEK